MAEDAANIIQYCRCSVVGLNWYKTALSQEVGGFTQVK